MAASFNLSVVRDLLDIVDDSKDQDKISEYQYIQMCNALKSIHNNSNDNPLMINYLNNRLQTLENTFNELSIEFKKMTKPRVNNCVKHLTHIIIAEEQNLFDKKVEVILDTHTNKKTENVTRDDGSNTVKITYGDIIVHTVIHKYLGSIHVYGPFKKGNAVFCKKTSSCGRFEQIDTNTVKRCQEYILNNSSFTTKMLKEKYTEINNKLFDKDQYEWKLKHFGPIDTERRQIENILRSMT